MGTFVVGVTDLSLHRVMLEWEKCCQTTPFDRSQEKFNLIFFPRRL